MRTFKEMENAFYIDVRKEILCGLELCTAGQQMLFKRMYTTNEHLDWPIKKVVNRMSRRKLDWASQQVYRTLEKKE